MDTSAMTQAAQEPAQRGWRRHSEQFKARVIELASQPHTSVAAVALANGLNANMLRRWVRQSQASAGSGAEMTPAFVQLPMHTQPAAPLALPEPATEIEVQIQRNGATLRASLPLDSRSAAWLREVTS
jgi:transposase-like protein